MHDWVTADLLEIKQGLGNGMWRALVRSHCFRRARFPGASPDAHGRCIASSLDITLELLLSSSYRLAPLRITTALFISMSTSAEISFNPATLEPKVREILTAPGTDLGSISAKNVRTKLVGYRPILTAEYMKEHKKAFDAVIGRVFETVSAEAALHLDHAASEQESDTVKDEEEEPVEEPDDAGQDEEEEEVRPKKKAKKASKGEMNDAELARQLSSEINGRTRRATTSTSGSASKKKPKPKRAVKKSAEMIASDSDDDASSPKKRKRTKSASAGGGGGGTAKGGFAKEYALRFVATRCSSHMPTYANLVTYSQRTTSSTPERRPDVTTTSRQISLGVH